VGGEVVGAGQRVGVPEALRAMTAAGAYFCFEEDRRGSLEVGKLADLLVLSGDPLRVEEDALKELRVELTMVGGRVVHELLAS
jgi:predicted amidohydrolase YtcJ